ncbi:Glutamine synthetase, partial [Stegodyphus mimosarum]
MTLASPQKVLIHSYMQLPQPADKVQCMYVWIDGSLRNVRAKSITFPTVTKNLTELPLMEFCGSATGLDVGDIADFYAKPIKFYSDPFRGGNNKLVFCETYSRDKLPTFANNRYRLLAAEQNVHSHFSQYGFQQSFTLLRKDGKPLSYMNSAYDPDSKSGFVCGREIAEACYRACLYAGVRITSMEPLSVKGQWKYCIGPCSRVDLADDVWMSRFILLRVAEDFGVLVSFETSSCGKLRNPISAALFICTESMMQDEKQRIVETLFSKFGLKEENPLRVLSFSGRILLSDLNADVDPYSA